MILIDETTAVMEQKDFDDLLDYSASVPTGQIIGKQWKCRRDYYDESKGWLMGSYEEKTPPDPDYILTMFRDIEVVA